MLSPSKTNELSRPNAQENKINLLSIRNIINVKRDASRRGIWFRSLNRIERAIIDLTVKYVDTIKSKKLAKIVTAIIEKLQTTTESMVDKLVRTIGLPLTRKLSSLAVSWGNRLASVWSEDHSFARFLVVNFGLPQRSNSTSGTNQA